MDAFIPEEGQLADLQDILDTADLWLMLFTNTPTIDGDLELGDLTAATFTGYADIQLTSWNPAATVAGKAKGVHDEVAFEHTSGADETVTGVAIYDGNGKLRRVRLFDTPYVMGSATRSLLFSPDFVYCDVSLA